jgi:hypothetical protein
LLKATQVEIVGARAGMAVSICFVLWR